MFVGFYVVEKLSTHDYQTKTYQRRRFGVMVSSIETTVSLGREWEFWRKISVCSPGDGYRDIPTPLFLFP